MMKTENKTILDKSVLVALKLGKLGNSKKVKDGANGLKDTSGRQVEVDADKDFIRVSKKLLEADELVAVQKLDSEIRAFIYNQCLPSLAIEGIYLLPNGLIEEVETKLKEFSERRRKLVEEFLMVYHDRVREAADRLRAVYDLSDYPSLEEAAESFEMEWRYLTLGVPEELKNHGDMFEEEERKAKTNVERMEDGIRQRTRENFGDIVQHMADRLSGEREGGKIKIFRDSMLTNAHQFISGFAFRNLTDDQELAELVAEFSSVLSDVTAEDLRSDADLRANTLEGVVQVQSKLQKLMEAA